jgi:feruloyl esterase
MTRVLLLTPCLLTLCAATLPLAAFAQPAKPCESLQSLPLPHTTITAAELVAAARFRPAGPSPANPQPGPILPAHCRIAAAIEPVADSHIEVEIWMPSENWNGKFEAVGNGGFNGSIGYGAMASALREGYASASTDTGHKGGSASFALDHPEKTIDFGYRAVHEMTEKAKALIQAYYGRGPRFSYWNGCSTGGRQGLKEAQRFPEDYDAILAGAPANYETHLHAWTVAVGMAAIKNNQNILPAAKLPLINQAVLAACDALDGVKDGLLDDPRQCRFDPATLLCAGEDTANCLTSDQVEAVRKIYAPSRTRAGALIFPSFEPGSELGWTSKTTGTAPPAIGQDTFRFLTYADPNWDWHTFDLDRDTAAADQKDGDIINAIDPDLSRFQARGGKLLMYLGWNDTAIAPENSINYYQSVLKKMGPNQGGWYRLFMVPGMEHCGGGPGPNQFSMMGALERWRESGMAPDHITAWHVTGASVDRSRPLCPYPQVAVWKGAGSTNDAASFTCQDVR